LILVDPRAGSADYLTPLRNLGAPVESVQMEFGDVAFYASKRAIGIELKKLNDMLQCIVTGRFSGHQLSGLARSFDDVWLIVEGFWRPGDDGVLETWKRGGWEPVQLGKRRWMYRDFDNFLTTIEVKGGVRVKRTASEGETARVIYGLYNWFQDVDGHRAHLALNRAGRDGALFVRPTLARRVAAELPGVGFERSSDVASAFPTVRRMLEATPKEWAAVKGIGKTLAKRIVEAWDSAA
jgi:ERCC4-type nuclease